MEVMESTYQIKGGIYLVLDPAMEKTRLLHQLASALSGGIQVVQIWNNWLPGTDKLSLIEDVAKLCQPHNVPLLINEDWQLLQQSPFLQGVHFDQIPADFAAMEHAIDKPFIAGITCSGDLDLVAWADENGLDYVSFCSMFPSPSAGSCDIVMPATVRQARAITQMPLFVSGGITAENILSLRKEISFDGVAVISGILSADDPALKVQQYKNALSINTQ
jgi:thiamine-phosphate pyrophosphorylase